ncbi:MAG: ClbS/DfsB family four-helix bundle protein [Chloroflexi bacterium]|nr:MAG: ClbS/DfsB family four-helix bundle protein [Chloroflexota bacterium]
MTEQDSSSIQFSKAELLRRIHSANTELDALIQTLDQDELDRPGSEGWSVKDHLIHLAVWERGIASHLQHQDRYAVMGVRELIDQNPDADEINEHIYHQHTHLSAEEAKRILSEAHQRLLRVLESLSEAELQMPYSAYLPEGVQPANPTPVWHYIVGNSNGHYEEHNQYIRKLLDEIRGK